MPKKLSVLENLLVYGKLYADINAADVFGDERVEIRDLSVTNDFLVTGLSTFISLDAPASSDTFKVNDVIQINNEKLLILGLDKVNNRYAVSRVHDNSTGSAHSVDSTATRLEKSFTFKVSGKKIQYNISSRRNGDVISAFADSSKAKKILNWTSKVSFENAILSAWDWEQNR